MKKIIFLLFSLTLVNLSTAHSNQDICISFFNELSKISSIDGVQSNSVNSLAAPSGIKLGRSYNSNLGWKFDNENGYPIIRSLMPDTQAASVLEPGDIVIKMYGNDIQNDYRMFRQLAGMNYDIGFEIPLLIKRKIGDTEKLIETKIITEKYKIDLLIVPELKILDITDVNAKKGTYSINYEFNYYWDDIEVFNVAKSILDKDIENSEYADLGFSCKLTEAEFNEFNFNIWQPNITFENVIPGVSDNKEISYYFAVFYNPVRSVEVIEISKFEKGLLTLSNKYSFQNFPFDRQILQLDFLENSAEELDTKVWLSELWLFDSDYITNFVDENSLFDWNINSYSINYFDQTDINYGITNYGISNTFEIQRNATYYLFKIIGPIFLILIVCWSVMWLTAKEVESRLTVTTVCLLSLVAYNFVIDQDLPRLAYFTKMDYIISLSYLFAALPTLIAVLEYRFYKLYDREISFTNIINYTGPLIYIAIVLGIIIS